MSDRIGSSVLLATAPCAEHLPIVQSGHRGDALKTPGRAEPVKLAPGKVENCALCLETLFFQ